MAFFQFLNDVSFLFKLQFNFAKSPLEKGFKKLRNEPKLASLALHVTEIMNFKK